MLVVTVGRNCEPFALRSLESIAAQSFPGMRVAVVDDASDDGTGDVVRSFCEGRPGWVHQVNDERRGAMRNQYDAWNALDPRPEDVVVWCDLDDRLAHASVLAALSRVYRGNLGLTYGNYRPTHTHDGPCDERCSCWSCPPVRPYPRSVLVRGQLRSFIRSGGGFRFNHLRTVRYDVLSRLTIEDMQDDDGNWWTSGPDGAVMIPCLEMVGPRHRVLADEFLLYTADNPDSEWRTIVDTVRANHAQMLNRPPKAMIR